MFPVEELLAEARPQNGYHRGIVVANNDPQKMKRLKIKIAGYLDGDENSLPWATPVSDSFLGGQANSADISIPKVGSEVVVVFPNNDVGFPFYIGNWQSNPVPSVFQTNYPNRHGRQDPSGTYWYVDETSKEFKFHHVSGFEFTIDEEGNFLLNTPGNGEVNVSALLNLIAPELIKAQTELLYGTEEVRDSVRTMSGDRAIYNGHTHSESIGSSTSPPLAIK